MFPQIFKIPKDLKNFKISKNIRFKRTQPSYRQGLGVVTIVRVRLGYPSQKMGRLT